MSGSSSRVGLLLLASPLAFLAAAPLPLARRLPPTPVPSSPPSPSPSAAAAAAAAPSMVSICSDRNLEYRDVWFSSWSSWLNRVSSSTASVAGWVCKETGGQPFRQGGLCAEKAQPSALPGSPAGGAAPSQRPWVRLYAVACSWWACPAPSGRPGRVCPFGGPEPLPETDPTNTPALLPPPAPAPRAAAAPPPAAPRSQAAAPPPLPRSPGTAKARGGVR
jgi:hypothetical protein